MQDAPFKIYSASAGSGKTYTLTKAYLKIILSSSRGYRKILALTFTNKAVSEMKHRILGSLFDFGQPQVPKDSKAMFKEVCEELQIEPVALQKKSKQVLKELLHDYAFFDISTIDKFTHRLIRTFARDLRLPQNFEVILEKDLLLDEAVARLIDKAGSHKKLTKVLIDFSLEKIDDDKSWDVAYDLNQIGNLLFNENHARHLKKLENKGIDDFLNLKKNIQEQIAFLEKNMVSKAEKALEIIAANGLEFSDFSSSYFPRFMLKIRNKNLIIDFNAGWKQNFSTSPLYNKSCAEATKSVLDAIHPELIILFDGIREHHNKRSFLKNAYGNVVPLTVLNAIQQEVKALLEERNQLSISEFNSIISKEIKDQPAPFIYERLGEKYRHYFIDEFQDTSVMQWNNLIPLVGNALESEDTEGKKGSLFLVGDGKQAIYRWRGGQVDQFLDIINEKTHSFVTPPEVENLPKNYRSYQEIVAFNNDFFATNSKFLKNEGFRKLFEEKHKQEHKGINGGQVQIDFIEPVDELSKDEVYCLKVLETIQTVRQGDYPLRDIAILVRDNKHGALLADFLTGHEVDVISSESLLLSSSPKVRFLIDLLHYSIAPEDNHRAFDMLTFLGKDLVDKHGFILQHLSSLATFLSEAYNFNLQKLNELSVFDGLEYAIRQFGLLEESDSYVTHFMDIVFEVEQKEASGVQTFLSHWERRKNKLSVTAPENINAVSIMSVHKAKGLEFPVVIFPFANSRIHHRSNDKKMWIPVNSEEYNDFEELLLTEKKEVTQYGELPKILFEREEHQMELDAFNVLYVALTRAIKGLFVITERNLTSKGEHKTEYYSGLFIHFLKENRLWQENKTCYSFGRLSNFEGTKTKDFLEYIPYQYSFKERPGFRVLAKSGILWDTEVQNARTHGNLLHYALGLIENRNDIPEAIATLRKNGDISSDEVANIVAKMHQVIEHPMLAPYYEEGLVIRNEADILTKEGSLLRPDRIVIFENKATLIDYKTGKKNPRYHEQLYTYADYLMDMGYEVTDKIIVYINESITPEFI